MSASVLDLGDFRVDVFTADDNEPTDTHYFDADTNTAAQQKAAELVRESGGQFGEVFKYLGREPWSLCTVEVTR